MTHTPQLMKTKAAGIVGNRAWGCRVSGFTMPELLVTIGIIGIVAALALPTISRMTESAKNGKCISNLKSTGTAIMLQAQENNGRLVLPWASASASDVANFPQLKDHPQANLTWFQYLNKLGYLDDLRSTVCPSFFPYEYKKASGNQTMMNYGMRRVNATRYEPAIIHQIARPASYVLLADSSKPASWVGQSYYITYPGNNQDTIHPRHNNRANIYFMDGSVRALNKDEILALNDGWLQSAIDTNAYTNK